MNVFQIEKVDLKNIQPVQKINHRNIQSNQKSSWTLELQKFEPTLLKYKNIEPGKN